MLGGLLALFVAVAPASTTPAPKTTLPNPKTPRTSQNLQQMPQALVVGLSHKTATVDVREKLSIPEAEWNQKAHELCKFDTIDEAAILSTCNRFEVYLVAKDHFAASRDCLAFLRQRSGLTDAELRPNLFMLHDDEAAAHLLRVSAGLDSLVVGEGQILSQVKACHARAIAPATEDAPAGSAGKVLGRLLNTAVQAGKFVRSETEIAKGAVSISSAAVELAVLKAPEDLGKALSDCRVCIVGAGKMSKLLMTHLASHGVTQVKLLNRGRERAEALAAEYPEVETTVGLMDELWPSLADADIAFTSTSATEPIVTLDELKTQGIDMIKEGVGPRRLALIDISVPRNVDEASKAADNVAAYNVDDLKQVVARNQARRREKVYEAEVLLRAELAGFMAWKESLRYVPAISELQSKYEQVRASEMAKAMKKLKSLDEKQLQAVEVLTKSILNKLLHGPMAYLRADDTADSKASVSQVSEIFQLGEFSKQKRR